MQPNISRASRGRPSCTNRLNIVQGVQVMGTQAKDQRFNATASNPPDRVSLAEHLLRYRRAQVKQHCMACSRPGEARVVRISGTRFRQHRSRSHGSFGLADELEHHMDSRIRAVYIRRHTYVLAFHPPTAQTATRNGKARWADYTPKEQSRSMRLRQGCVGGGGGPNF